MGLTRACWRVTFVPMRPIQSITPHTSSTFVAGGGLVLAGATNKVSRLALCSCLVTGGSALHKRSGRRGNKGGDGILYRPLSCAGPSGAKHCPARLFRPKFALMQMVGGSTRSLSAARSGPLCGEPGMLVYAAQLVLDKYSQAPATRNPPAFPWNGLAFLFALISDNAMGERAVDNTTVGKRSRCYREERGRRQQQGRPDSYQRGAGGDKSSARRHVSYGEHPWAARVVRPANLLTRQG